MRWFPRRFSCWLLLAAVGLVSMIILIYSHSSWKDDTSDELKFAHQHRKHPIAPDTQTVNGVLNKIDMQLNTPVELAPYDPATWPAANYDVHVFYYIWYGNPAHDTKWYHWNHKYMDHWNEQINLRHPKGRHKPPDDIGANFYPQLGPYSSRDPEVLDRHMYEIRKARIGVISVSWYPPGSADEEGKPSDRLMPAIFQAADKYDIKVCFHIEPFTGRTAETLREAIKYIIDKYGNHNAFYRRKKGGKQLPLFYMYDSYQVKGNEWRKLFSRLETLTVRDTEYDGIFVGLAVQSSHPEELYGSGFDGMYTYFASDTFVFGSKPSNWHKISSYCKTMEMLFIPSVGPGYIDTEVRPWNGENIKNRDDGAYYRKNFKMALTTLPDIVSITSFNEWHEGTQIEAAVPHGRGYDNHKYLDYGGVAEASKYMDLTRDFIESWPNTKRT